MKKNKALILIFSLVFGICFSQDIIEVKYRHLNSTLNAYIRGNNIIIHAPNSNKFLNLTCSTNLDLGTITVPGIGEMPNPSIFIDYSTVDSIALCKFDENSFNYVFIKNYKLTILTESGESFGIEKPIVDFKYLAIGNIELLNSSTNLPYPDFNFKHYTLGNEIHLMVSDTINITNVALKLNIYTKNIASIAGNNIFVNTVTSSNEIIVTEKLNLNDLQNISVTGIDKKVRVFKVKTTTLHLKKSPNAIIESLSLSKTISMSEYNNFYGRIIDKNIYIDATTALGTTDLSINVQSSYLSEVLINNQYIKNQNTPLEISNFSFTGSSFPLKVTAQDGTIENYMVYINIVTPKDQPKSSKIDINNIIVARNYSFYQKQDNFVSYLSFFKDTIFLVIKNFEHDEFNTPIRTIKLSDLKNVFIAVNDDRNLNSRDFYQILSSVNGVSLDLTTRVDLTSNPILTVRSEDGSNQKNYVLKPILQNQEFDIKPEIYGMNVGKFKGVIQGNKIEIHLPSNMPLDNLNGTLYISNSILVYLNGILTAPKQYDEQNFREFQSNFSSQRELILWNLLGKEFKYQINIINDLPIENPQVQLDSTTLLKEFYIPEYRGIPIVYNSSYEGIVTLPFNTGNKFIGFFGYQNNINLISVSGIPYSLYSENNYTQNITTTGTYLVRYYADAGNFKDFKISVVKQQPLKNNKMLDFEAKNIIDKTISGNNIHILFDRTTKLDNVNLYLILSKANYVNNYFYSDDLPLNVSINGVLFLSKLDIHYSRGLTNYFYRSLNLSSPLNIQVQAQDLSVATYKVSGQVAGPTSYKSNELKSITFKPYSFYSLNGISRNTTIVGNNIYVNILKTDNYSKLLKLEVRSGVGASAFVDKFPIICYQNNEVFNFYDNYFYDFSKPVNLDIFAENGDKISYTIYVNYVDKLDPIYLNSNEIESVEPKDVVLYPNPANGDFFNISLEGNGTLKSILLFDLLGNVVKNINSNEEIVEINTSNMNKGIYFVKISTEKSVFTKKLIIEK